MSDLSYSLALAIAMWLMGLIVGWASRELYRQACRRGRR